MQEWVSTGCCERGRIAADFTTDFMRFVSNDQGLATSSALGATLTQPLLRGAGYRIAIERLTQAERNLLYAIRDFTRFRKEFSVEIVASYYQVLQNRDRVRNAFQGYESFKVSVEREQARAAEGETPSLRTQSSQRIIAFYRTGMDQRDSQLSIIAG